LAKYPNSTASPRKIISGFGWDEMGVYSFREKELLLGVLGRLQGEIILAIRVILEDTPCRRRKNLDKMGKF